MTTPGEVKMALEARLLKDGRPPRICGLHSIVEHDGIVSVIFDLEDEDGGLFFLCERPTTVSRTETREFVRWLMDTSLCGSEIRH
jgi:hypothetical protein